MARKIRELLSMQNKITMERAHIIGPYNKGDKAGVSRPVIAKILDFNDKIKLFKAYSAKIEFILKGHNILLFYDYSDETTRRRKFLLTGCSVLYKKTDISSNNIQ